MRSFTDTFIKHPVLAIVVNLVLLLVGWRALSSLPVQQYPQIESSSVVITTVYTGASAETVRGFLTTPIERAVSAISGVDYLESTSRAGVSTVNVRLKLNHSSTPKSRRGCSKCAPSYRPRPSPLRWKSSARTAPTPRFT
jgi:multidrug efflux pump